MRSLICCCLLSCFTLVSTAQAKAPAGLSGTLSIIPGLGQVVNGNFLEGLGWFGVVMGTAGVRPYVAYDLWMYNMYDAYRDAKPQIKRYKDHSAFQNYIASYNPVNIVDPVGGPLLVGYGMIPGYAKYKGSNLTPLKLVSTSFIGFGEEGLFRGFLFPAFSDLFSSKFFGALVSSALFGLVHTQYGSSGKLTVGLVGLVQCWQLNRNAYDLRKNIFAHSTIDFFLLPKGVGPLEDAPARSNTGNTVGIRWGFGI